MLLVVVRLRTKPGKREELIELAKAAIAPSRAEEGCISYIFLQDPYDSDSFMFYEEWRSREDLDLHFEEPHFKVFAEKSAQTLESPADLVTYDVTNESKIG